jgi:hypothetical protein
VCLGWLLVFAYLGVLGSNLVRFFSQHAETTTYDALFAWLFALPGPFASSGLVGFVTGWAALSMLLLLLALLAPSRSVLLPALGS